MTEEQKKLPIQKLQELISHLEVIDVFLKRGESELYVLPIEVNPSKIKLNFDKSFNYQKKENHGVVIFDVTTEISADDKEDESKTIFKLKTTMSVVCNVSEDKFNDLESDALRIFNETNAEYNSYPYLREFFHSQCNRMAIPPIVLPFLKPISVKQINEKFGN